MSNNTIKKGAAEPFIRLDFLDALRFFAIIYIAISHLALIPQPNLALPEWIVTFIINEGEAGVSLFFILSAFSLSYSMDARAGEAMLTSKFYIRRFFRIVPLFYFMMLVYWIRDAVAFGVIHPFSEVLINASLLFNLVPSCITGFVWASWTIGVMALLYLLFPLIHRYTRNLSATLILLVDINSDRARVVVFCYKLRRSYRISERGSNQLCMGVGFSSAPAGVCLWRCDLSFVFRLLYKNESEIATDMRGYLHHIFFLSLCVPADRIS